jgi:hypothetical protein
MAETTPALQFDKAEFEGAPQATVCGTCGQALVDTYYDIGGVVSCDACRRRAEAAWNEGSAIGRFLRAFVFGTLAALAGSAVYFGVLALTGYEVGYISILVGFMVGAAVKAGCRGRGGWLYQGLAMFLTYSSIVLSYIPLILKEGLNAPPGQDGPLYKAVMLLILIPVAYAAPFLAGISNVIGILIIGFGVYQAWKINKKGELQVSGPYRLAARPGGASPAPTPAA